MNDEVKRELTIAQRAWVKRVLGVDAEQEESEGHGVGRDDLAIETSRRRGLRAELHTRTQNVLAVTSQRLKALTPGSHGATDMIARAKTLRNMLDQAVKHADLASDEVAARDFDAAAGRARTAIEAMQAPWPGMASAGEAQALEAAAAAKRRDTVVQQFDALLTSIGEDLQYIRQEIVPGPLDLKLRDLQNIVYQAHNAPAFARPTDATTFEPAHQTAAKAVETFKQEAENELAPVRTRVKALMAAKSALGLADQAADKAVGAGGPFANLASALAHGLRERRAALAEAQTPAILETERWAVTEAERAEHLRAAAAEAGRLQPAVKKTIEEADPTPGAALKNTWEDTIQVAGQQLGLGEAASATLGGIVPALQTTQGLTAAVGLLRERTKAWTERRKALPLPPSKGETQSLLPHTALFQKIGDDVAAVGTLESELATLEKALEQVATDIGVYIDKRDQAGKAIDPLVAGPGWPDTYATTLRGRIESADRARQTDPGKALKDLEALVGRAEHLGRVRVPYCACWELAPEVAVVVPAFSRDNNFASWKQKITNAIKDNASLSVIEKDATDVLGRMQAVKTYLALITPHKDHIETLKKSAVTAIAATVKKTSDDALNVAKDGKGGKAQALLQTLIPRLAGMLDYHHTGDALTKEVSNKRKDAPAPLNHWINQVMSLIANQVRADGFAGAAEQLKALNTLLDNAAPYRKAHAVASPLLTAVEALAPSATRGADTAQNEGFRRRLDAAITGEPSQLGVLTTDLVQLAVDLAQARTTRQQALRGALGGGKADPRTTALFDDPETAAAVAAFTTRPGEAALKALIARLGKTGDLALGKAVAAALKGLNKGIGADGIVALGNALGGVDKIAGLCSYEGDAGLANGLHKEFEAELPKLTSMVNLGLGGDPARVRGLVGGGGTGAKRLKAMSDKFVNRTEMVTLVTNLGTDAEARTAMEAIASAHFDGDWGKLKDPFFDTLASQPDSVRLMKKAQNFKAAPSGSPPQPAQLGGFVSVDMKHTVERHRPENFALAKPKHIKKSNTQFAPGTPANDIAAIISSALVLLRGHLNGPPSPAVTHFKTKGTFIKYFVNVAVPGVRMQIGYDTVTNTVDQAFPVRLLPGATITLDDFDNVQMNAMKEALGK